jgi:two-component system alkaline phosphatase synthesis response regulator PhoP
MNSRILLVEDDPGLILTLSDRLRSEGYAVEVREDGDSGLAAAMGESYDLVLLDVMLPKRNGFDVCRKLREGGAGVPILMLTARGEVVDKVVGLKSGADDYLTKPFETMELLARIEALMRRAPVRRSRDQGGFQLGALAVDFRRAEVTRNGEAVQLSAREYRLFCYLIDHCEEMVSREELLTQVWGVSAQTDTRTVDVHIAWLRQKLEENPRFPRYLHTIRGQGYKLAES